VMRYTPFHYIIIIIVVGIWDAHPSSFLFFASFRFSLLFFYVWASLMLLLFALYLDT
jgi:hypothetical protein